MNNMGIEQGDMTKVDSAEDAAPALSESKQELSTDDELKALLSEDESRLGDVYRGTKAGQSAQEIADSLDVATSGFVSNYRQIIAAVTDGAVPPSKDIRRQAAASIRSLIKRNQTGLTANAVRRLREHLRALEDTYDTQETEAAEGSAQLESQSIVTDDLLAQPGIYAFSYGWYLDSPMDPERGYSLIKVGRAANIRNRVQEHQRWAVKTHMPEPLVLVRAYTGGQFHLEKTERLFHRLLATAGHHNPRRQKVGRSSEVGKEWFLTSEDFLDAAAAACGMQTIVLEEISLDK